MMMMMCPGHVPAVSPGEACLPSSGQRSPHRPQPADEASKGGDGGRAGRPLQLPESRWGMRAGPAGKWTRRGRGLLYDCSIGF